jgi:hypothetical protein
LPLQRVDGSDSGAVWELEQRAPRGAALVVRQRVLGLVVIELLIGVEQTVPAILAILARLRRVADLRVVLETRAVAMLVVAVVTQREDGEVPRAVDAAADADAESARTAHVCLSVVKLWVGIVGACQNAVAVEIGLFTCVRDLQLLVQAQVAEARENAHDDGSDEFVSVRCSSAGQKLVADEKEIWRSVVVEWLEKEITRDATGLLAGPWVS